MKERSGKRLALLAGLLVVAAACVGCGAGAADEKLYGKWRSARGVVLVFRPDGTLVKTAAEGAAETKVTYNFGGADKLSVVGPDAEGFPVTNVWRFELTEDGKKLRLRFETEGNARETFERVGDASGA